MKGIKRSAILFQLCFLFLGSIASAINIHFHNATSKFSVDYKEANATDSFGREEIELAVNYSAGSALPASAVQAIIKPTTAIGHTGFAVLPQKAAVSLTQATSNAQILGVSAIQPGKALLDATILFSQINSVAHRPLRVYVFPPKQLTVAVHLVNDTNGMGHTSGLLLSDVPGIMNRVNDIWASVNIKFIQSFAADITTFSVLTAPINYPQDQMASFPFFRGDAVQFEIFLVNNILYGGTGTNVDGDTKDTTDCAIGAPLSLAANYSFVRVHGASGTQKSNEIIARTIAHELGHAMGLKVGGNQYKGINLEIDTGKYPYRMMDKDASTSGTVITPLQRDCISPI